MDHDDAYGNARWLAPFGMGMAFALLPTFTSFAPTVRDALFLAAGLFLLAAGYQYLRPSLRRRDRFDLEELRRVHEREELKAIDPGGISEFADRIVCPHCGRDYSARFPICPSCRR